MSYDRYESQRRRVTYGASSQRTTLGYWVPLVLTVTVATIGLAAWVWKERGDDDDDEDKNINDGRPPPGYENAGQPPYTPGPQLPQSDDPGLVARMQGALRRTPSPQQFFDEAGRRVVAGVTAAGVVVGGALGSIREEDKGDYEDHSRWSEEAAAARAGRTTASGSTPFGGTASQAPQVSRRTQKGKIVAIVVSADTEFHGSNVEEATYVQEHAVGFQRIDDTLDTNL